VEVIRLAPVAAFIISACSNGEGSVPQASARDSTAHASDSVTQLVLRARAFDRADNLDSARILYAEAAKQAREVKDWLLLRAAGVTKDKSRRDEYLADIDLPVAKDRRKATEAIALERAGDVEGAIAAYTAAGDRLAAIRLRMLVPSDTAKMVQARRALIEFLQRPGDGQNARDGIALFDRIYKTPTAAENLIIARAAFTGGLAARAVSSWSRAFAAGLGTSQDHFNSGMMLARLNRDTEAAAEFARVTTPSSLAAAAQYQRARAFIALGRADQGRTVLNTITTSFANDTSAASALMLLADLATDQGRDADARKTYLSAAHRFPSARHAPASLFKAGLIAYVTRDYRAASNELDSIVTLYPNADDALAAAYWSGRSWKARGDTAQANRRWRALIAREGGSYYSVQSAKRLGAPLLQNVSLDDAYPKVADVDAAMRRIELLKGFGMDTETRFEYDRLYKDASASPERVVATAHALAGTDQSTRSITLGRKAVNDIAANAQNYRLVYPVLARETLISSSKENGLDPVLVASLIRQESNFNPRATSPVGARGLMQVMPSVGRTIASSKRMSGYTDSLLWDPVVNIKLGTAHLSGLFRKTSNVEHVLAAYNAGESRVARWSKKTGADDPEVFIERIPFFETRDYVRSIIRNRAFYSILYRW
jgi:soluble lytic murein transglycosylase-like protein